MRLVLLVLRESKVFKEKLAQLVLKVPLVQTELMVHRVFRVNKASLVHKVFREKLEQPAPRAIKVFKEKWVLPDHKGNKESKDR